MVGMTAISASAAQMKKNNPLREKQVAEGIALALELGLGVWKVSRPGREFVKIEDEVNHPSISTNE